jgi:opacity protein-like surface antigen
MKQTTLITAVSAVSAIAHAGAPVQPMSAPEPAPVIGGWFIGGTYGMFETDSNIAGVLNDVDPYGYGYLFEDANENDFTIEEFYEDEFELDELRPTGRTRDHYGIDDFEFDMYTLHIGRDLSTQFLGCDLAAYLEVGFISGDATLTYGLLLYDEQLDLDYLFTERTGIDIDIIPVTINLKAEREFFGGIKGYITAGIGYAFTKVEFLGEDESDGGLYAQAQIGLAYDITDQWEIYGGARWMYLSGLDLGFEYVELDDAVAYEIGLRYSF